MSFPPHVNSSLGPQMPFGFVGNNQYNHNINRQTNSNANYDRSSSPPVNDHHSHWGDPNANASSSPAPVHHHSSPSLSSGSLGSLPTPPPSHPVNQNNDLFSLLEPVITPQALATIADQAAGVMGFGDSEVDIKARNKIRGFVSVGKGLSYPELATKALHFAAMLKMDMEIQARSLEMDDLVKVINDVKIRLGEHFDLSSVQKANIRTLASSAMMDATRTAVMDIHLAVMKELEANQKGLQFTNIFGNPAREKMLLKQVKLICSNVRSQFRGDLRACLIDELLPLTVYAYKVAMKYRRGGAGDDKDASQYSPRLAVIRHFAELHKDLLVIEEAAAAKGQNVDNPDETGTTGNNGNGDGKGRGGRPAKGKCFWSAIDKSFAQKVREYGANMKSDEWRPFIKDIIEIEKKRFPDSASIPTGFNRVIAPLPARASSQIGHSGIGMNIEDAMTVVH